MPWLEIRMHHPRVRVRVASTTSVVISGSSRAPRHTTCTSISWQHSARSWWQMSEEISSEGGSGQCYNSGRRSVALHLSISKQSQHSTALLLTSMEHRPTVNIRVSCDMTYTNVLSFRVGVGRGLMWNRRILKRCSAWNTVWRKITLARRIGTCRKRVAKLFSGNGRGLCMSVCQSELLVGLLQILWNSLTFCFS